MGCSAAPSTSKHWFYPLFFFFLRGDVTHALPGLPTQGRKASPFPHRLYLSWGVETSPCQHQDNSPHPHLDLHLLQPTPNTHINPAPGCRLEFEWESSTFWPIWIGARQSTYFSWCESCSTGENRGECWWSTIKETHGRSHSGPSRDLLGEGQPIFLCMLYSKHVHSYSMDACDGKVLDFFFCPSLFTSM